MAIVKIYMVIAASVIGAAMGGCAVREANLKLWETLRPASSEEKAIILTYFRNTFFDPYSIRDAEISTVGTSYGPNRMICVRLNSKNRLGAYVGRQVTLYTISESGILGSSDDGMFANIFCTDGRHRYVPFPEAERIGARS